MESNLPVIAKRVWSIIRVAFFMLRKGISKGKLMKDLNMILKRRGKLAGEAISNLMFHGHYHDGGLQFSAAREYEFSCSNTPNYFIPIGGGNKRHKHFFACAHAPPTHDDDAVRANAVKVVLEMLNNEAVVEASPALPGFGKSPMGRQLRVTDSPFPVREAEEEGKHNQVDMAAEEFIKRFYKDLKKQA